MGIRPSRVIVEFEGDYRGLTVIDVEAAGDAISGIFWGDRETYKGDFTHAPNGSSEWMWHQGDAPPRGPCWVDKDGVLHCPTHS